MKENVNNEGYVRDQAELSLLRTYRRMMKAEESLKDSRRIFDRERAAREWLDADLAFGRLTMPSQPMEHATALVIDAWQRAREERERKLGIIG